MLKQTPLLVLGVLFLLPLAMYAQPSLEKNDQSSAETKNEVSAPSDSQALIQVDSLAVLDAENQKLGNRILQRLSSLPEGSRVRLGSFLSEGEELPLGAYWRKQLLSILSVPENRNFIILNDATSQAEYVLNGEIMPIGNILRIYTRLTKSQDGSLITTWNTDLLLTPFIDALAAVSDSRVRPDMYEPDSMDKPLAVEIGAPQVARTIHQGDEDWFSVLVATEGILILETSGSMDTFMELYDGASGSRLASNDDGGSGLNARIEYFAEAGKTYIVKVRGTDGDTGSYRFGAVLNALPVDPNEPNDTKEEATPIELGKTVDATFHNASDVDWYKLSIPEEGGFLTVYTRGRLDTSITLYDEEGATLADDDDSGSGLNARVSIQTGGGTLYIKVQEVDGDRGSYTLHTQLVKPGPSDAYEPDNTPETAKEITIGTPQERTFTTANDVDWVKFTVSESGYYEIRTIAADRELDTYIVLYDEEGEYIDDDDDSGDWFDAYLRVKLDPGTYVISIRTLDGDPLDNNAYTLSVSASGETQ